MRARVAPAATFDKFEQQAADHGGKVRVIVGLQTRFDPAAAGDGAGSAAQRGDIKSAAAAVLAAVGGHSHHVLGTYSRLPYVALELSPAALQALEASHVAASIQEDRTATAQTIVDPNVITESAPQVSRGWGGSGKVVAQLDSGVDTSHPFLAGRIYNEACFSDEGDCPNGQTSQVGSGAAAWDPDPNMMDFHGTAVGGFAVGKHFGTVTLDGDAPDAQLLPVRVLHPETSASEILAGLNWLVGQAANGVPLAAVNLSIGNRTLNAGDCTGDALQTPIDALRSMGVATVIAAGNDEFTTGVAWPACVPDTITVGATDGPDQVASFSNSSPQVELLAPGNNVQSAAAGTGDFTTVFDGTSLAAPQVAGAWAQYLERYPGTSVADVLAAFQRGGKPVTDARNGVTVPRLDVAGAMAGWGFVVGNQSTTASYQPSAALQGNSTGATNTITRTGTGTYSVQFPKLGTAFRGSAQVRTYLGSTNRCVVATLGGSSNTVQLNIRCTTPAGTAADTQFVATYQVNEVAGTKKNGYLVDVTPASSATPIAALQADALGGTDTVTRFSTGRYGATFPNFTGTDGVPQVTALAASSANSCQITGWVNAVVGVACFDATGAPADTAFSLSFEHQQVFTTGKKGAYIYASDSASTTPYTPAGGASWNSLGTANTSVKTATGSYTVTLGALPSTNSVPLVSAVENSVPATCRPYFWGTSGGSTYVQVRCTDLSGNPVDAKFTLTYGTTVS